MAINDLTDKDILNRISMMDRWMKKFRDSDVQASYRYLDVNAPATGSGEDWSLDDDYFDPEGDVPEFVPIGQPNYLAINNETKIAAIAMGTPALHVRANEDPQNGGIPNAGEMVAKAWDRAWMAGNWGREAQAGLQKLGICGLGMLWYRWDSRYGPCFEHVPAKRLLLDPHATNLLRMEYGGVKVRMPLRRAIRLYDPNGENAYFAPAFAGLSEERNLDNQVISVSLYFDVEQEVHAYGDKILHREENYYKKVPLIPIEGFIDPRERLLPLGSNVFASGLNQQVADLASMASNTAKHGGPITLASANAFDDKTQEALKSGQQQQILFIKGPNNPQAPPVLRIGGEQLSPAYPEARREAQQALDGIMGVTSAQRGEQIPGVTATQSVMVENRSGARATQDRADCERWYTRMAEAFVEMMQHFGGPTEEDPGTQETRQIWQAFKAVQEVQVVEGSSSYMNPAADKQATMQLYTTIVQSFELWLAASAQGLVQEIPNLKQFASDVLRAFSRQNMESYFVQAPQPQQQPQGPPPELMRALTTLYKTSPPDVKRQIEQDFGLTPSQLGEPEQGGDGGAELMAKHAHEQGMQASDQEHDALMKMMDHAHQTRMEQMKQQHAAAIKVADIGHQARMASVAEKSRKANGK